jgi:hypothetical protein
MFDETISKSRIYFDGVLPGSVVTLKSGASAKVMGASNDTNETKHIDRTQLITIAKKLINEWCSFPNARIDAALEEALDDPNNKLEIVCPEGLFINPFPIMLKCTECHVLEFHHRRSQNDNRDDIEKIKTRIRQSGTRRYIACNRASCSGRMMQLLYVAIHRCGLLTPIDIPHAAHRVRHLGFRDNKGSFYQTEFFDVDTGSVVGHALQDDCPSCKKIYDKAKKQGRPIDSPDRHFPHNFQYLCLKETTGKLVSDAVQLFGDGVAKSVVSCLIGIISPNELENFLKDVLKSSENITDVEKIRILLNECRKHLKDIPPGTPEFVTDLIVEKIKEYENRLKCSGDGFSEVLEYIPNIALIAQLGSSRRAIEAAMLPFDFYRERETLRQMSDREVDPTRRDKLVSDALVFLDRYGIREITHYKEINVVMASLGYTRELDKPNEDETDNTPPTVLMGYVDKVNLNLSSKTIIYALPAKTEAIHISLDPRKLLLWCINSCGWEDPGKSVTSDSKKSHAYLLMNSPALCMDPSEVLQETKFRPLSESAPFHLLHTISHCLLGTIKRHTGYDQKSVMEYLIPMDLSIILYVTSVQNYTAGGLLTLFRHHLHRWLDEASNYAFNCIFDPLCSDRGSSCSGCVQVVMGCETFNHGLSRSYLHGGKTGEEDFQILGGFWS